MYSLLNTQLTVSVLDPVADRIHCGSRYCTGGYIWQVTDNRGVSLLSGPHFPSAAPPPYDGQGAPESFVTPLGADTGMAGELITVIGVGRVLRSVADTPFNARFNPEVHQFCEWDVGVDEHAIGMTTSQADGDSACTLERGVTLKERTVISSTKIINTAHREMPLRWFPHPFFPLSGNYRCCRLGGFWTIPENDGYTGDEVGTVFMKKVYDWKKGLFLKLDGYSTGNFSAQVFHPSLESVTVKTSYPPGELPVWANSSTFSPEPYLVKVLAPGECASWQVSYTFNRQLQ